MHFAKQRGSGHGRSLGLHPCNRRAAVTLIELLVVLGIIAVLVAVLMPALSFGRQAAHDLKCRANMRSVIISFNQFADPTASGRRGDSEKLGASRFQLEDFQESVYGVSEFWQGQASRRQTIQANEQVMVCPAGATQLDRKSGVPCDSGAVGPASNITIGFNMRLHTMTRFIEDKAFGAKAVLTDKMLTMADVPLLFDVDGQLADDRGALPYYSAPPIPRMAKRDIYFGGHFWFPAMRHRMRMNIGYIGGHVVSTANPLGEPWTRWDYQPDEP
jgi:Tfp pilus assembly protein PilE